MKDIPITYLPNGPRKRDRQDTVFYARKHNTGFPRPQLKQPRWVYDPDKGVLTDLEKVFWSAVIFVHQETSGDWYGVQGEPGWQQALEDVLSGYGRRHERILGPGLTESWCSTWQEELTTDRARNQVVPQFLNELGLLTATGRRWNQESWKKFRQRFRSRLQLVFNWIMELRDNQERTLPTPASSSSFIYKNMKVVEGVLEKERQQRLDWLSSVVSGYKGSQRKGRPRKETTKNPAGVSGPYGPSTAPIDNDKIRRKLIDGMKQMNMKPNKGLLKLLEGGVG